VSQRNRFSNANVESWFRFIFRSSDSLKAASLYFLSHRYSTSPRYFPLYNSTSEIRVVLFRGSRFPGVDRLILKTLPLYIKFFRKKFDRYSWVFLFSLNWSKYFNSNQILNLDDPDYTKKEIHEILNWELNCQKRGLKTAIATTTIYTKEYFKNQGCSSKFSVIPQGHSWSIELSSSAPSNIFKQKISLIYASPYIHTSGDLHGDHELWGANTLLWKIWPCLALSNLFELHLVGSVGQNAMRHLENTPAILHGLVSSSECARIMHTCDIGLYPRESDKFRQAQKVSEYIGAGLAVVAFDCIDASLVKELGVGISVNTVDEFIEALRGLERDRRQLASFKRLSQENSKNLRWQNLAKDLDLFILNN
jgi:hypothetical protein